MRDDRGIPVSIRDVFVKSNFSLFVSVSGSLFYCGMISENGILLLFIII